MNTKGFRSNGKIYKKTPGLNVEISKRHYIHFAGKFRGRSPRVEDRKMETIKTRITRRSSVITGNGAEAIDLIWATGLVVWRKAHIIKD